MQSHSKKAQPAALYYLKSSATVKMVFSIALECSFPLIAFESKQKVISQYDQDNAKAHAF